MKNYIYNSKSENDTKKIAKVLASKLKKGDLIVLCGELGSGKTKFTEGFLSYFGLENEISSPTFTIVKEYREGRLPLFHFDVYRVSDPEELFNIGCDEYFYGDGLCVVEWADLIEEILPENTKYIYIEYGPKEGERIYKCTF